MEAAVQPAREKTPSIEDENLHEAIMRRAHELWELRGRVDGHAEEDWAQARDEVLRWWPGEQAQRPAFIVVKVGDFTYTGEYDPRRCSYYRPGDLGRGSRIPVRFEDDRMYVKLQDGRELETKIVRRALG
jgi:Protein of unknown function (DUF2934)